MKYKFNNWRIKTVAVIALSMLAPGHNAYANPSYPLKFKAIYKESQTLKNAGCQSCHADGSAAQELNAFGKALCDLKKEGSLLERLAQLEELDSDGDGSTNIQEILASTQPGWTNGDGNEIFFNFAVIDCPSSEAFETAPGEILGGLDISSDYSFQPPKFPEGANGGVFNYFLPANSGFSGNVNLKIQSLTGTLNEYDNNTRTELMLSGLFIVGSKKLESELQYEFIGFANGRWLHWFSRAIKKDNKIYLITATSLFERWEQEKAILVQSVNSLTP